MTAPSGATPTDVTSATDDGDDQQAQQALSDAMSEEAEAALGDKGKQALDRMKAEVKELRGELAEARAAAGDPRGVEPVKARATAAELREQLAALQAKLDGHETALPTLQSENARLRVAIDKKLPSDLVDRLKGSTAEELAADADKLLALMGSSTEGVSFDGGARSAAKTTDMNEIIRRQARR